MANFGKSQDPAKTTIMRSLNALSFAPDGAAWLEASRHPRILHVFANACNLINEQGQVLSIVTQKIGDGPFNLVVKEDILFSDHLNAESKISVQSNQITLENLNINIDEAELWSSRPNWKMLHALKENIHSQLTLLTIPNYQPSIHVSLLTPFSTALVNADIPIALEITHQLAGLGQGLTPSGDDYILGAILAAWIIHPQDVARVLAEEIMRAAAPRTTSLSAAWLRSAGRGEAGILWHNFFNALIEGDSSAIQLQVARLLSIGHTSGEDAFAGFIDTFKSEAKSCPS